MKSIPSIDYTKLRNTLGAARFKPEAVGEEIVITVTAVREVSTRDGASGICVEGFESDSTVRDWVAWNRHNKEQLLQAEAQLGDVLRIRFLGTDPEASGPLAAKWFELELVESKPAAANDIDFDNEAA